MSLKTALSTELKKLVGLAGPVARPASLTAPGNVDVAIDFIAVDSMSCSFREIRLRVPALASAGVDRLQEWAEKFCKRVTYLLEHIGPIEVDPEHGRVLVRSTPPDKQDEERLFYEILLQSHANGNFSLRRYRTSKPAAGRAQVDMQTTHEVLLKLVDDLVDTIPASA